MSNRHTGQQECPHDVYIKGMCGNCGIPLDPPQQSSSVSMIHSVPELKVSKEYAKNLGKEDQERLIKERKLVLLVDLDQTLLHTTHEPVKNDPNVHSFQLWPGHPIYYTKLRPYLKQFLDQMSEIYELHIFTFGCRLYAHKIASIIDPDKKYFGNRILSRDESVDQYYKENNLNNLFPCGDSMVCIIDDRADVWRDAGNLIQVKAYTYFKTSISDGAMLGRTTEDEEVGKLEALLEEDKNNGDENVCAPENMETRPEKRQKLDDLDMSQKSSSDEKREHSSEKEVSTSNETLESSEANDVVSGETHEKDVVLEDENESSDRSEDDEEARDDPDDYLLHLPPILNRIHEKWYMELDEQRRFLVDGESYKIPDIKDIIKKYLRKKF